MPRLGWTSKVRSFPVKKTWFQGLTLALGALSLSTTASAQYSNGNIGAGLSASSFNANASGSALRTFMELPAGRTTLAGYSQNGPVGSGVSGGSVHISAVPGSDNSVLNSRYQVSPTKAAPDVHPYEQMPAPNARQHAEPMHATPLPIPQASLGSSCTACNSGSCSAHGVGMQIGQIASSISSYGSDASCYEPAVSCGPAIASPNPWIFGAGALIFTRFDDEHVRLTSDPDMPTNPLLSTSDAAMQATGGFQLSAGRYFGCGKYAIVGSYWGVFSNPQMASVTDPGAVGVGGGYLRSNLPFTLNPSGTPYGITMPGDTIYNWYDGSYAGRAYAHRIQRDQQFHNAELNFFSFALGGGARQPYDNGCGSGCGSGLFGGGRHGRHGGGAYGSYGDPCGSSCDPCASASGGPTGVCAPWYGAQCSKLRLNLFGGIRWFRFEDSLEYASSSTNNIYGDELSDVFYRNGVTNDLVGFQLGSMANWCTGTCLNFFAGTSFGVFGNHMNTNTYAGTNTAAATIFSTNAFNGRPYDYSNSLNDVAFLAEGNIGTGIRISRGWTANLGYRVVGVNGVATAVGQIPRDFSNGEDINRINNTNSLLLHGVVLGAAYNF